MKKRITIAITTITLLLFTACGGESSSTPQSVEEDVKNVEETTTNIKEDTTVQMKLNKAYTIQAGQKIIKQSEDAKISLQTDIASGQTIATLMSGKARIEESQ